METPRKTIPTNDPANSGALTTKETPEGEVSEGDSSAIINNPSSLEKIQDTSPVQKEDSSTPTIRTYKSDAAEAVKRNRESVASIVSAEQDRKKNGDRGIIKKGAGFWGFQTKTSTLVTILSLLVLSSGIGLFSFFLLTRNTEPVITPSAQTLVFVNKEVKINIAGLDKKGLETKVREAKDIDGAILNDFIAITFFRNIQNSGDKDFVEKVEKLSEVLSILTENAPSELLRSLGEDYLYGVHILGGRVPFLIAKVRSYENAFSGLIAWEKSMTQDIAFLFDITRFPPARITEYTDVLIKNRDVRAIFDEKNVPILYYSFIDRETLVITPDKTTFDEILNRLATPKRTLR